MSPRLLALIEQGFLQVDERKKVFALMRPVSIENADDGTRAALASEMRAVYGEMLSLGYQLK